MLRVAKYLKTRPLAYCENDGAFNPKRRQVMFRTTLSTLVLFLVVGVSLFSAQRHAHAVSCDSIVGDWAWFTGGNVTLNPDGTITSKEFGNLGTWECTDDTRGVFTLRWVFGTPPFVDTLTLSADGQSLSGKNQYQYPVTVNRISIDKNADDVLLSQNNIGYIPSLNAKVTSLRFFESGYNAPPREQRVYSDQFDKSVTRYINWEINLEHPAPGHRIDFVIEQLWYRPNGSLMSRQTFNTSLNPEWTSSYFHHSYGWRNPGNWSNGSYRVDLFVGGQKVTSGSFEIYSAGPADAYFSRGNDYLEKEMYDEAIAEFNKAVQINPKFSSAYNNRCDTYRIKKQYQEAISDCTKAIELKPDFADAYYNRGLAYDYSGQYDKAILDYTKAIELNPKEHKAYNNRGVIYSNKKKLDDKAISDYTKAIEINPNYTLAYANRCNIYLRVMTIIVDDF